MSLSAKATDGPNSPGGQGAQGLSRVVACSINHQNPCLMATKSNLSSSASFTKWCQLPTAPTSVKCGMRNRGGSNKRKKRSSKTGGNEGVTATSLNQPLSEEAHKRRRRNRRRRRGRNRRLEDAAASTANPNTLP
uniref:Predicted protein n=1 Tax=Physcomitrium patens TaxID=3218 RepID=A9TUY8_PHYPA